jgi:hypothetical protein
VLVLFGVATLLAVAQHIHLLCDFTKLAAL